MSNGKNESKRLIKKKRNDCFRMENIFCLESHIHLCSRHTSANPAYVIKTCLTWHAFFGAWYWGFVSPKLHVSIYRNQQHCWWFHYMPANDNHDSCTDIFFWPYQTHNSYPVWQLFHRLVKPWGVLFIWIRYIFTTFTTDKYGHQTLQDKKHRLKFSLIPQLSIPSI